MKDADKISLKKMIVTGSYPFFTTKLYRNNSTRTTNNEEEGNHIRKNYSFYGLRSNPLFSRNENFTSITSLKEKVLSIDGNDIKYYEAQIYSPSKVFNLTDQSLHIGRFCLEPSNMAFTNSVDKFEFLFDGKKIDHVKFNEMINTDKYKNNIFIFDVEQSWQNCQLVEKFKEITIQNSEICFVRIIDGIPYLVK